MPLVSVVIPAYNAAPWIAETLESVLVQTFQDIEVIVVDDGSTDETAAVVARFARVHFIPQENQGSSAARNAGIRVAQGEYIAFLDADDLWAPDKLRLQMETMRQTERHWVYSDAYAFDATTRRELFVFSRMRRQYEGDVLAPLFLCDFIPMSTPVVRRSVLEDVGYFCEGGQSENAEDWDLWIRIAARYPVARVTRPLAWYRVHPESKIQSYSPATIYEANLRVIERAVDREAERLEPFRDRAVALLSIRVGQMCARRGDLVEARKMFAQAVRLCPVGGQAYIYWLGTFVGRSTTNAYVWFLHWLRRKRSGV